MSQDEPYTQPSCYQTEEDKVSQLVADCPRCDTKRMAFEVRSEIFIKQLYGWQDYWEVFCLCGRCNTTTVFTVALADSDYRRIIRDAGGLTEWKGAINDVIRVKGYVSTSDKAATPAPEFLPANIKAVFDEGAKCLAVGCFNASATMFRLCVDMTTKDKLPIGEVPGLNNTIRRNLGHRLPWLFENRYLPEDLRDLSHCIKEDGNDGAHEGTLTEDDALDLLDFTTALLERVYTQPEKLKQAGERRAQRRSTS